MRGLLAKVLDMLGRLVETEESPSTERLLYRRKRAIAHECGHAAIAWLSPVVVAIPGITFKREGDRAAQTAIAMLPSHPDLWIEKALICLGGLAGEVLVWRRIRSGGFADDIPEAMDALELFLMSSTIDALRRRWEGYLADSEIDVAAMLAMRPRPEIADGLNLCFRRAKRLLMDNRDGFDRLVALAGRKGDLAHEDIASQFGPRPWAPPHR